MGKIGKGKTMLGVSAPAHLMAIITERSEPLRMSKSAYTLAILEQWIAAGCPAVTEADRAMLHLRELERKTLPPKVQAKRPA